MVEYGGISTSPQQNQQPAQAKKGPGCWFWGCLTVVVLLVLLAIGIFFGARYFVRQAVMTYSTTEALTIPVQPLTEDQYTAARSRVESFSADFDKQTAGSPLILSSDDINALIAYHPDMEFLKNMAFLDLRGSEVYGRISIPLERFGFAGRFVNAEGKFTVALNAGRLSIYPLELAFNGKALPTQILKELQASDLTEQLFERKPEAARFFDKFESINVSNGTVTLVLKKTAAQEVPAQQ